MMCPSPNPSSDEVRRVLHEVWLAVHVRRFDKHTGKFQGPDNFYAGTLKAERSIAEVAARYGIDEDELRTPAVEGTT